ELERLFEGLLGLFDLAVVVKQLGPLAPRLGVGGVLLDEVVQKLQRRVVLAVGLLLEGTADGGVDRLTAPLEFFAAAARARRVRVQCHNLSVVRCPLSVVTLCSLYSNRIQPRRESSLDAEPRRGRQRTTDNGQRTNGCLTAAYSCPMFSLER